jgi:hypothetical protein
LNAKVAIIGQTRNCPKCKNPVLIERPQELQLPSNLTPITSNSPTISQTESILSIDGAGQRIENLPERLNYHNRYIIISADRIVAIWESGRGWQVNVGNGFASAKKNVSAIPDQGTFAFVELVIDSGESNLMTTGSPTSINVFKIAIRGALTALYRDENEILRKINCQWNLTKNQQTILWNYLSRNFNAETIAAARTIIMGNL